MEMGKTSATGSFQLLIGNAVSSIILAVGTIVVGIFIFEDAYGLYAVALIPATTMLLFQDWGIASAMTKYCAQYRATNKRGELRKTLLAGLTFASGSGAMLMVILLLMANFIATAIFGKPDSAFLIALAALTVLSAGLLQWSQSVLVGFERMGLNSIVLICRAVAQGISMPLLVYLGYGAMGAIAGYTFSIIIASIIALFIFYFEIFRKLPKDATVKSTLLQTLKPLLAYGVPLAFANIVGGALPQFSSFIMASLVDNATIGSYRIATNFSILLTFLTFPISTVLFPAFSKIDPQKEPELLKTLFTSSVKYTAILLIPATMAMMVLSQPLVSTIYGNKWLLAPSFLTLYVLSNIFAIFGNLSLGSLLFGLGETKLLMKLSLLTLSIGVPMAILIIPPLGVFGVILVTVFAGVPSMCIGLSWIWKKYGAKTDFYNSAKIFIASSIAAAVTYLFVAVLNAANWILLVVGGVLFLAIYLAIAPVVGAINHADIYNIRAMFSSLGLVSKIIEIPLVIMQKILRLRSILTNKRSLPLKNL